MTTSAGPAARPPASAGWLYGPVRDLVLGCGLGSMVVMLSLAVVGTSISAVVPGALLVLLFSLPHYGATLVRVYELPEDRHKYSFFALWCTLALGLLFVLGLRYALLGSLILTLYLTWSPWHYSAQNYGIFLIILSRRGVAVDQSTKRLVKASFILSYVLALLAIHGVERTANYAPVSYAGTVFRLIPLGLPSLVATPLIYATAVAYLGTLSAAVVRLLRTSSLSQIAPGLVLFCTQALWFSVPVLARFWGSEEATQAFSRVYNAYGFLWIASAHAIQYLWVTSYYASSSRDRATGPKRPSTQLRYAVSIAFAGFAIWTLPVLLFAPGVLGSLPHESGLALLVAATVNLHHFVLDGVVWKLRDGRVAQILLRAPSPSTPPAGSLPRGGTGWPSRALWATGAFCMAVGLFALWEEDVGFRRSMVAGDTVRARAAVERLALLGRDGPTRRTQLGREMAKKGEYRAAGIQFALGQDLHPTADNWKAIALLHEHSGRWLQAVRAYQAAGVLAPDDATIRYKTGLSWLAAGEPAKAIGEFEAAAELAPDQRLIQLSLARARRETARAERADPVPEPSGAQP